MIIKDTWGHYLQDKLKENQDRIAVVDIGKNVRCTYRDLQRRSESIEKAFLAMGVTRGTHVALVFPSSSKWIAAFMALINIGAVSVCLNSEATKEEIEFRVIHSEAKVVITNEEVYKKLGNIHEEWGVDEVIIENRQIIDPIDQCIAWHTFISNGTKITESEMQKARDKVQYDDPLAIQYTSGTTGTPKAVLSIHYKVLSNMKTFQKIFSYTKQDKILSSLPMYHVMGCFFSCLMVFSVGASLVLMGKFNTDRTIDAIIEEKCTSFHGVPTMYKLVMNKMGDKKFTCLNKGMIGGSCCDRQTMEDIMTKMNIKHIMPNYGQSEACGYTQIRMDDPIDKIETTVGRPAEGIEIRIINDKGEVLPADEEGEIIVYSPYRMAGYYKNEEATTQVIKDDWIYTGDLGKLDKDGYLTITGRKKDLIIRGGENISPMGIECVLRNNEYIQDIVAVGVPDEVMGQEIAVFVLVHNAYKFENEKDIIEKIKEYAMLHLAKYEQPRYIRILDKFPLTGSGKIQKFKLAQMI